VDNLAQRENPVRSEAAPQHALRRFEFRDRSLAGGVITRLVRGVRGAVERVLVWRILGPYKNRCRIEEGGGEQPLVTRKLWRETLKKIGVTESISMQARRSEVIKNM
jgi:hypothetical protein